MDAMVITFLEVKVNTEIRDLGFIAIIGTSNNNNNRDRHLF